MKIDKKYYPMIGLAGGIVLLLIIIMVVMLLFNTGNQSFQAIEARMLAAAQNYYQSKGDELPKRLGEQVEVDISKLVSEGYMKDISTYREGTSCTGKVIVSKFSGGYSYTPNLKCGQEYKTSLLVDKLLSNVVTSGDGLYKLENIMKPSVGVTLNLDETGYDLTTNPALGGYIFRGLQINNYIKIDDAIYRVIKIDKNNDMYIIQSSSTNVYLFFDDRYNSQFDAKVGYNAFATSGIKRELNKLYNSVPKTSVLRTKAVPKNLCVGGRFAESVGTDGKYECSKVVKDQYIAFLPAFDVMNASLSEACTKLIDKDCANDNSVISDTNTFTLTPDLEQSSHIYVYDDYSGFNAQEANLTSDIYPTMFLSNTVVYVSGNGSEENPYIIK